jgi:hypothetical protein
MSLLSALLDRPIRQPASVLVQVGTSLTGLGNLAGLVKAIELTLTRAEAGTGSITFEDRRKEDGQWLVADSGLFARWRPIRVTADFGIYKEEVLRGYIKTLKPHYPKNGGDASLEVELQDESSLLDREHMRRVWGEGAPLSDRSILEALALPLGFKIDTASAEGRASRSLNQDGPPIRFLRDRAKANGYELIFDQGTIYFGPPRLEGEPMPPILVYAGSSTNCSAFSVEDDALKPDAVRYDAAPAAEGATPETQTVQSNAPVLGRTAGSAEGSDLAAPFVWRMSREGDESAEDMRVRAQALANDNAMKLKANGELDGSIYGHVLKPGRLVTVDGAGQRYGGLYYVEKVSHAFSPDGYKETFELKRNATGETASPLGPLSGATSVLAGLFG